LILADFNEDVCIIYFVFNVYNFNVYNFNNLYKLILIILISDVLNMSRDLCNLNYYYIRCSILSIEISPIQH